MYISQWINLHIIKFNKTTQKPINFQTPDEESQWNPSTPLSIVPRSRRAFSHPSRNLQIQRLPEFPSKIPGIPLSSSQRLTPPAHSLGRDNDGKGRISRIPSLTKHRYFATHHIVACRTVEIRIRWCACALPACMRACVSAWTRAARAPLVDAESPKPLRESGRNVSLLCVCGDSGFTCEAVRDCREMPSQ